MKQTIILAALVLFMVGCGNRKKTLDSQPIEVCVWENGNWATEWMQKYADYMRNNTNALRNYDSREQQPVRIMDVWTEWGLAYIDDDTIPEMIMFGGIFGDKVLTIHDGNISECFGTSYIPKSGLVENKGTGKGDQYWDIVLRLKEGEFTEIFSHIDCLAETNKYYCFFDHDSVMRAGELYNCHQYDQQKNDIYTSAGQRVNFYDISRRPSSNFEQGWHPRFCAKASKDDIKLMLLVK